MKIKLSPFLVGVFLIGVLLLFVDNRWLSILIDEKQERIEDLTVDIDSLAREGAVQMARVDSLGKVVADLLVERDSVLASAKTAAAAAVEEPAVQYSEADSIFTERFDSVTVISPGLFAVKRELLEDYSTLKDVRLPLYRVAVSELQAAVRADSVAIDALIGQNDAHKRAYFLLNAELGLTQERESEYRDLFQITQKAYKAERRKRKLILLGAGAAVVATVILVK